MQSVVQPYLRVCHSCNRVCTSTTERAKQCRLRSRNPPLACGSLSWCVPTCTQHLQVRWLPRGTLKTHTAGADVRYILSAATSRRPSWQDGTTAGEVRWFDATTDTLAVRVPLTFPSKEVAGVGGFKCPCPACPQCTAQTCSASGATTSCCTDPSCADSNFRCV